MTAAQMTPDEWQTSLLRCSASRLLLLASRQSGKSEVAAALALQTALLQPGSLTLLLSPSERQSTESALRVARLYDACGRPVQATKRTALQLHLDNGSRIIALPESERTIRGYSGASLIVVDEAARVSDELYRSVRPMLAVSRGRMVCLSTPFGQRGFFHEEWTSTADWERIRIPADACPRISPEFLREERRSLGERWYRQEYLCSFEDVIGAVFPAELIEAMFSADVRPLALLPARP